MAKRNSVELKTLEGICEEIDSLRDRIRRFQEGGEYRIPSDFSYPKALKRLQYLRNRQRMFKKKEQ